MRLQSVRLFTPMSPAAFAPFDGLEGLCALARDDEFRLVWCNRIYADLMGRTPDTLVGTRPEDHLPVPIAAERKARMREALRQGSMVSFYQLWRGARWHTRVWPLDPEAFGVPGYFIILNKSVEPATETASPPVLITRLNDLGDLAKLSKRELEVLYYLAGGLTVNEIASTLFRSPKTIGRHTEHIHKKMGYANRAELVRDATERGLVAFSPEEWAILINLG